MSAGRSRQGRAFFCDINLMGWEFFMKRMPLVATATLVLFLAGCSNMSNTQQRVLSGGAIGAAGGAAVTAITGGCIWCGAAIGGAVGAGAGYVISQSH
jgi:osmotically inducible lipoprotein OsmB